MLNSSLPKLLRWHTHFARTNSRFGLPSSEEGPFLGSVFQHSLYFSCPGWCGGLIRHFCHVEHGGNSDHPGHSGRCGHLWHCGHVGHGGHCGHLGYLGKGWHGGHGGNGLKGLHDGHGRQSLHGVHERVFQNPLIWKTNLFVTSSYPEKNFY